MENRNGFFQLHIRENGTYLRLFPPLNEGKPVTYDEINDYLTSLNIFDYNTAELNLAIQNAMKYKIEIKILETSINPVNETLIVRVSPDDLMVIARFYPPTNDARFLNISDIKSELKRNSIVYGIDDVVIEAFLKNRKYCEDVILAKGLKLAESSDAVITYHFNVDKTMKPKTNEDGTVDFHQLDIISNVNKGDILATLKPAVDGVPGIDVYGNKTQPKKVNRKILRHGKDIHLSEDGLTMISDISGHVMIAEERVFVANTYEILADVDSSTGDIVYDGSVTVKGNVITGFSIHAQGDIIVNGVVEGAKLVAGGHIILKRGMQGMSKGTMEAKGNIVSKFIENADVKAGGYISTEAILHSKVSAKGEITVGGKKGFITGGEIHSAVSIRAKTAGSTMGTNTVLEVGIEPKLMEEHRDLEKLLISKRKDLNKLLPIVESYMTKLQEGEQLPHNKVEYIRTATESCIALRNEIKEITKRCEMIQIDVASNESANIKIENIAYPGVKIVISNVVSFLRSEVHHSKFIREKADIRIVAL